MVDSAALVAHEENPALQHQFSTEEQQFDTATLGMWTFIVSEVLFFGGMFVSYAVFRGLYPQAFAAASEHMALVLGAVNTAVLICSSLTMALAVRSAQLSQRRNILIFLLITMAFGVVFLAIKAVEYYQHWADHLIPGFDFRFPQPQFEHTAQLLFYLYFAMTGLHALHMIIGLGLLTALLIMAKRNIFRNGYFTPVEIIGLYWHFVDIIWIFLFPLLYLVGHQR